MKLLYNSSSHLCIFFSLLLLLTTFNNDVVILVASQNITNNNDTMDDMMMMNDTMVNDTLLLPPPLPPTVPSGNDTAFMNETNPIPPPPSMPTNDTTLQTPEFIPPPPMNNGTSPGPVGITDDDVTEVDGTMDDDFVMTNVNETMTTTTTTTEAPTDSPTDGSSAPGTATGFNTTDTFATPFPTNEDVDDETGGIDVDATEMPTLVTDNITAEADTQGDLDQVAQFPVEDNVTVPTDATTDSPTEAPIASTMMPTMPAMVDTANMTTMMPTTEDELVDNNVTVEVEEDDEDVTEESTGSSSSTNGDEVSSTTDATTCAVQVSNTDAVCGQLLKFTTAECDCYSYCSGKLIACLAFGESNSFSCSGETVAGCTKEQKVSSASFAPPQRWLWFTLSMIMSAIVWPLV